MRASIDNPSSASIGVNPQTLPVILVAEDDRDDTTILKRALARAGVTIPVRFVTDGQEVLDYLQGIAPFDDRVACPLPTLLLLDLKMPRLNGFEVLEWVRRQPAFNRLVIAVFSGVEWKTDIVRAYGLGADLYVEKPNHFDEMVTISRRFEELASSSNLLPLSLSAKGFRSAA